MNAFRDDLTLLDESNMNEFLTLQPYAFVYEGEMRKSYEGTGAASCNLAEYNYATKIIGWNVNDMLAWAYAGRGRIELLLNRDSEGADLIVQIRDALFNPNGGSDGNLLKEIIIPKEFISVSTSWISIPVDIALLNMDSWILCKKAGDSRNKIKWSGDAAPNPSQPCYYRAGDSGAWTETDPLSYRVITGITGLLKHEIYAQNGYGTFEYNSGLLAKIYSYLPPSDGAAGGIREVRTLNYDGSNLLSAT